MVILWYECTYRNLIKPSKNNYFFFIYVLTFSITGVALWLAKYWSTKWLSRRLGANFDALTWIIHKWQLMTPKIKTLQWLLMFYNNNLFIISDKCWFPFVMHSSMTEVRLRSVFLHVCIPGQEDNAEDLPAE